VAKNFFRYAAYYIVLTMSLPLKFLLGGIVFVTNALLLWMLIPLWLIGALGSIFALYRFLFKADTEHLKIVLIPIVLPVVYFFPRIGLVVIKSIELRLKPSSVESSSLQTNTFSGNIQSPENRRCHLAQTVYSDPKGFFKIRPPEGWIINEYPTDPRGKVDFNSSNASPKAQLKVIGQTRPSTDFDEFLTDIRIQTNRMQARAGGRVVINEVTKFNVRAVETVFSIPARFKQLQIHVLLGKNYYTFAFGGPPDQFEQCKTIALSSIESFEPIFSESSSDDVLLHIIASHIRKAEIYLSMGRKDWALIAVEEGLSIDGQNRKLLELRDICRK